MQLERRVGETLFVNAGSVGWPYEGRPGAYWALIDDEVRAPADRLRPRAHRRACPRLGASAGRGIAAENILVSAPRAEALAVFGG